MSFAATTRHGKEKFQVIKYSAAYAAALVVMVVLDLIWLGLIAKSIYQEGIGHLMADRPNIAVAILFYLIFSAGLLVFAIAPNETSSSWAKTALTGALFGFFAYATYDLSNLSTLKDWPVALSMIDIAWGTFISAMSAIAGKFALSHFAGT
jgi:uncharacterized membrane protein